MADHVPAANDALYDILGGVNASLMPYILNAMQEHVQVAQVERREANARAAADAAAAAADAARREAEQRAAAGVGILPDRPPEANAAAGGAAANLHGATANLHGAVPLPGVGNLLGAGPLPAAPLPGIGNQPGGSTLPAAPLPGVGNLLGAGPLPAAGNQHGAAAAVLHGVGALPGAAAALPDANANREIAEMGAEESERERLTNDPTFEPELKAEIIKHTEDNRKLIQENRTKLSKIIDLIEGVNGLNQFIQTNPTHAAIEYLPIINIANGTIQFKKYTIRRIKGTKEYSVKPNSDDNLSNLFEYKKGSTYNYDSIISLDKYINIVDSFRQIDSILENKKIPNSYNIKIKIRELFHASFFLHRDIKRALEINRTLQLQKINLDIAITDKITSNKIANAEVANFRLLLDSRTNPPKTYTNEQRKELVAAYNRLREYYIANPTRTQVRDILQISYPRVLEFYKAIDETRPFGFARKGRNGILKPEMAGGRRTALRRSRIRHGRKTLRKSK